MARAMSVGRVMEVLKPGMSSTFQDLGRVGFQHLGVPVSGAMDEVSHRLANWLVGNADHEPTLEVTVLGPALRFSAAVRIALTGADLSATCVSSDGSAEAVSLNRALTLQAGQALRFGHRLFGARAYLAVQGGFGLAPVLGSASTYVRGGLGGWQGRALEKGDVIPLPPRPRKASIFHLDDDTAALVDQLVAELDPAPLRAMPGPEWAMFRAQAQAALFERRAIISRHSDRMGYRLTGWDLLRAEGAAQDILSEAVALGTVQVPNDGAPIVLMSDRQSTGGYPRVAQVATVDIPRLAQMMPGDSIRFERIDADTAEALLLERARRFDRLRSLLLGSSPAPTLHHQPGPHPTSSRTRA